MIITICGSMGFAKEMLQAKERLNKKGYVVMVPELTEEFAQGKLDRGDEHSDLKRKIDAIREHYNKIAKSDAVLVLNYKKKNIENYIGGNSFLEIGFAHVLCKKIYLLNPIPSDKYPEMHYTEELKAMQPIILNNDLSVFK